MRILYKLFVITFSVVMSLIGLLILLYLFTLAPGGQGSRGGVGNPFFPPQMNAAAFAGTEFVIGDLGGVPARIPHYFANYIEYEGDPDFGEKRKGPKPERTYQSQFTSFGFKVRFPDMAGRSSPELWRDFNQYHDVYWEHYYDPEKSISPWMSVGITTGRRYAGVNFLDVYVDTVLRFDAEKQGLPILAHDNYAQVPKPQWGLTVYSAPGIDKNTGKPHRENHYAKDLFVHRNSAGKVQTFIRCRNHNIPGKTYAFCTQTFSLEPSMHVLLNVHYTSNFLPHWRQIQKNISRLMRSFEVAKTDVSANAPALALPIP